MDQKQWGDGVKRVGASPRDFMVGTCSVVVAQMSSLIHELLDCLEVFNIEPEAQNRQSSEQPEASSQPEEHSGWQG